MHIKFSLVTMVDLELALVLTHICTQFDTKLIDNAPHL
ncbi:unnamed protein product [Arabidopsis halleri]